jgi:hypothetical protein
MSILRKSCGSAMWSATNNQQRLRIRPAKVLIDRRELFLLLPAPIQRLHVAQKQHLERRHQRRRLRQVQRLKDRRLPQVQIVQAEVASAPPAPAPPAHALAAHLEEERLIAQQHIPGRRASPLTSARNRSTPAKLFSPVRPLAHRKLSSMSLTSACAKSFPIRRTAAPSSCTKPAESPASTGTAPSTQTHRSCTAPSHHAPPAAHSPSHLPGSSTSARSTSRTSAAPPSPHNRSAQHRVRVARIAPVTTR